MSRAKKNNNNEQGETTVSKEKENGLVPKEEMVATGKGTGRIAKLSFQAGGKFHEQGKEILGVDEKTLKELESQGLVEEK